MELGCDSTRDELFVDLNVCTLANPYGRYTGPQRCICRDVTIECLDKPNELLASGVAGRHTSNTTGISRAKAVREPRPSTV